MKKETNDITKRIDLLLIGEKKWIGKVKTKWSPPEGFFTQSAEKIAKGLKSASKDLKQAMSRLMFYVNRGGTNISNKERKKFEKAEEILRKLYKK